MPFTFAHPSAVLPFIIKKNKDFDFTALIVGSMSPDFEYFIHLRPYQVYGHTILGQLYYNLPLVFTVSIVWHYILKEKIIENLPSPFNKYYINLVMNGWKLTSIKSLVIFIYSAFIGMATHIIWDSFTHSSGYFVTKINFLSQSIYFLKFNIPIYKILQHGSTIIGLSIFILYLLKIQQKNFTIKIVDNNKSSKFLFWISIVVINFTFITLVSFFKDDYRIGSIIVEIISGGFLSATIVSLLAKIQESINQTRNN